MVTQSREMVASTTEITQPSVGGGLSEAEWPGKEVEDALLYDAHLLLKKAASTGSFFIHSHYFTQVYAII